LSCIKASTRCRADDPSRGHRGRHGGYRERSDHAEAADLEDSYLLYLEALHETDATSSMRVAGLFLKAELDATRREATELLKHWAQTFSARYPRP